MFMVEGKKMVGEAIQSDWPIEAIVAREDVAEQMGKKFSPELMLVASKADYSRLSSLQNPEGILAVIDFPHEDFCIPLTLNELPEGQGFILDAIQDPGNLGTILRIADWFGFKTIIAGPGTVDLLNPRTLRSSMGAIFRVNMVSLDDWGQLIDENQNRIYTADLKGISLEKIQWTGDEFVVIGNEANGISEIFKLIREDRKIMIPGDGGAESLNAGIAAGILAWNMRYA